MIEKGALLFDPPRPETAATGETCVGVCAVRHAASSGNNVDGTMIFMAGSSREVDVASGPRSVRSPADRLLSALSRAPLRPSRPGPVEQRRDPSGPGADSSWGQSHDD